MQIVDKEIFKRGSTLKLSNSSTYYPLYLKQLWHPRTLENPVYDDKDHGVSCRCCTPDTVTLENRHRQLRKLNHVVRPRGRPKQGIGGV